MSFLLHLKIHQATFWGPLRPMSISSSKAPSNDESQGKEIEGGATGRATGVRRCWITALVNMVGEMELHMHVLICVRTFRFSICIYMHIHMSHILILLLSLGTELWRVKDF